MTLTFWNIYWLGNDFFVSEKLLFCTFKYKGIRQKFQVFWHILVDFTNLGKTKKIMIEMMLTVWSYLMWLYLQNRVINYQPNTKCCLCVIQIWLQKWSRETWKMLPWLQSSPPRTQQSCCWSHVWRSTQRRQQHRGKPALLSCRASRSPYRGSFQETSHRAQVSNM